VLLEQFGQPGVERRLLCLAAIWRRLRHTDVLPLRPVTVITDRSMSSFSLEWAVVRGRPGCAAGRGLVNRTVRESSESRDVSSPGQA
jgi:hypothetical protein